MAKNFYAVVGYDDIYGGLHGMVEREIVYGTEDYAWEVANDLGKSVISSYGDIEDELEATAQNEFDFYGIDDYDSDEADALRESIWAEDVCGDVYELDASKLPTEDLHELAIMFNDDPEDFIDKYAKRLFV